MVIAEFGADVNCDEDREVEFKMHVKNMLSEIPSKSETTDGARVVRTKQPNSKTVCAFLNTDGGYIYIGVDDNGIVRGIRLTKFELDHFYLSLKQCLASFTPKVNNDLVKIMITEVYRTDEESFSDDEESKIQEMEEYDGQHSIGNTACISCRLRRGLQRRYLITLKVSRSNDTWYQNEEGLTYVRRNGSNRMVSLDELRQWSSIRIMSK